MTTLVEFLAPVKEGPNRDRVLATMHYYSVKDGITEMQPVEIRDRLVAARIPRARNLNVSSVLARSGHLVDRAESGYGYWFLTGSGRRYVEEELRLSLDGQRTADTSPATPTTKSLHDLVENLEDDLVREYLEEAVWCLQVRAFRAGIVFVWTGAIRTLEEQASAAHSRNDITQALQKHDPNARTIKRVSDFAHVQDSKELLAFEELGLVDKAERQTLEEALGLRNKCGHPTTYKPGEAKVAAFIEDVIGIVFS